MKGYQALHAKLKSTTDRPKSRVKRICAVIKRVKKICRNPFCLLKKMAAELIRRMVQDNLKSENVLILFISFCQ